MKIETKSGPLGPMAAFIRRRSNLGLGGPFCLKGSNEAKKRKLRRDIVRILNKPGLGNSILETPKPQDQTSAPMLSPSSSQRQEMGAEAFVMDHERRCAMRNQQYEVIAAKVYRD